MVWNDNSELWKLVGQFFHNLIDTFFILCACNIYYYSVILGVLIRIKYVMVLEKKILLLCVYCSQKTTHSHANQANMVWQI